MREKSTKFTCQHKVFAVVNYLVLFIELASPAVISKYGHFSGLYILCIKHGYLQFCLQFYCTVDMKTKLMIEARPQR